MTEPGREEPGLERASGWDCFYAVVAEIPRGKVATYGGVARLSGVYRGARAVGWALRALPPGAAVPWWRVISSQGCVSPRAAGMQAQADLLRQEGVVVSDDLRVDLERYLWDAEAGA